MFGFPEYDNEISIEEAEKLYDSLRNLIINTKKHKYRKHSYINQNENIDEKIKNKYMYERGCVVYKNINGDTIVIKISRSHAYKRRSRFGIEDYPIFKASINIKDHDGWDNDTVWSLLWNLNPEDKRIARVTSPVLPLDILIPETGNIEEVNNKLKIKKS